eukprot:g29259.t2
MQTPMNGIHAPPMGSLRPATDGRVPNGTVSGAGLFDTRTVLPCTTRRPDAPFVTPRAGRPDAPRRHQEREAAELALANETLKAEVEQLKRDLSEARTSLEEANQQKAALAARLEEHEKRICMLEGQKAARGALGRAWQPSTPGVFIRRKH